MVHRLALFPHRKRVSGLSPVIAFLCIASTHSPEIFGGLKLYKRLNDCAGLSLCVRNWCSVQGVPYLCSMTACSGSSPLLTLSAL